MSTSRTDLAKEDLSFYQKLEHLTNPMLGSEEINIAIEQLKQNSQAEKYISAHSLASSLVGKVNLHNREHLRLLNIAQATEEQQFKFDITEITDRLMMESSHHVSHQRLNNDIESLYKGFGTLCSASSSAVGGAEKAKLMPKPIAYVTRFSLKGVKHYFEYKAKEAHNLPAFGGFNREDLQKRFNYLSENPNQLDKLIKNPHISFTPNVVHNDFSNYLKTSKFNVGALTEKEVEAEFFSALSKCFKGNSSRSNKTDLQKEIDIYISKNTVLNKYVDDLKKIVDKEQSAEQIRSAKLTFQFIGALGEHTKCKDLQRISAIGSAAMDIYAGYSALTGMSASLSALSSLGSTVPVVGAFIQIGTSILQVVSAFKKKRSQNADSPMLKRLDAVISQIYNMHIEMRDSFQQVFKNQEKIYQVITSGFQYIDTLIHTEIRTLKDTIRDGLTQIDQNIHRLSNQLNIGVSELHLMAFRKTLNDTTALLEGRLQDSLPATVEKTDNELLSWIAGTDEIPPAASNKFHTGSVWIESENKINSDDSVRKILNRFNQDELPQLLGYLACYAEKHLEMKWESSDATSIAISQIFNPHIWIEGVAKYIEFRNKFWNMINQPELSLERVIKVGLNTLNFIVKIQKTPELFQQLFENYHQALEKIVNLVKESIEAKNKEINTKIKERFYKDEKHSLEAKLDLCLNLDDILTSYNGKLAPTTVFSGNTIDLSPPDKYCHIVDMRRTSFFHHSWRMQNVLGAEFPPHTFAHSLDPTYLLLNYLEVGDFDISYKISINAIDKELPTIGHVIITNKFRFNNKDAITLSEAKYNIPAGNEAKALSVYHIQEKLEFTTSLAGTYHNIESRTATFYQAFMSCIKAGSGNFQNYPHGFPSDQKSLEKEYIKGMDAKTVDIQFPSTKETNLADAKKVLCTKMHGFRKAAINSILDTPASNKILNEALNALEANRLLLHAYATAAGLHPLLMSEIAKLPNADNIMERIQYHRREAEPITLDAVSILQDAALIAPIKKKFLDLLMPTQNFISSEGLGLESKSSAVYTYLPVNSEIASQIKSYLTKLDCVPLECSDSKSLDRYYLKPQRALTVKPVQQPKIPKIQLLLFIDATAKAVLAEFKRPETLSVVDVSKKLKDVIEGIAPDLAIILPPHSTSQVALGQVEAIAKLLAKNLKTITPSEWLDNEDASLLNIFKLIADWIEIQKTQLQDCALRIHGVFALSNSSEVKASIESKSKYGHNSFICKQ